MGHERIGPALTGTGLPDPGPAAAREQRSGEPTLSVVIPTWNGRALLGAALESLRAQTWRDFETIVVDNASTDGTLEMLARDFPEVRTIGFSGNRGFAAAVNAGIRASQGDLIVLMNNDTEAAPGWLAALVDAMDRHPEVGFCASRMMLFADRDRIDSTGDRMALQATPIGRGRRFGPEFSRERYVFSACAGAAAYRRRVFDDVGVFDERFFAYLEDVDLGFRAQIAGHRCLYVPDAVIYHHGSATSDRVSDTRAFWLVRNSLFLFFQNMPARVLLRHGWFMFLWPFVDAIRQRRRLAIAARGWLAFCADLPEVLRRRRRAWGRRRISPPELVSRLALPDDGDPASASADEPSTTSRTAESWRP